MQSLQCLFSPQERLGKLKVLIICDTVHRVGIQSLCAYMICTGQHRVRSNGIHTYCTVLCIKAADYVCVWQRVELSIASQEPLCQALQCTGRFLTARWFKHQIKFPDQTHAVQSGLKSHLEVCGI